MDQGFAITREGVRDMRERFKRTKAFQASEELGSRVYRAAVSAPPHVDWVVLSSIVPLAGTTDTYPGQRIEHEGEDNTWSGDNYVYLRLANGEIPTVGKRYLSRLEGEIQLAGSLHELYLTSLSESTGTTIHVSEIIGGAEGDVSLIEFEALHFNLAFGVGQVFINLVVADDGIAGIVSNTTQEFSGSKYFDEIYVTGGTASSPEYIRLHVATDTSLYMKGENTDTITFANTTDTSTGSISFVNDTSVTLAASAIGGDITALVVDCNTWDVTTFRVIWAYSSNAGELPCFGVNIAATRHYGKYGTLADGTVVKGGLITTLGSSQVALGGGGTGANLADPGSDKGMFWDDSAGQVDWLTYGDGLAVTGTTLAVTEAAAEADSGSSTVTLSSVTDPADSPATADALRDDLVTNAIAHLKTRDTELESAIESLATSFNSLLAKMRTANLLTP